ncbi:type IV secretory system conjugative DNA transfer family protein [Halegenticoccus tardaugens]|uniref:type IV secretory system conjugative DNA transfer family protein n=1 Tax=Halegenticoccus tardaugens TaxID=2071624 RepID=UPI00100B9CDF|nr:type IV secretion system DNA-binding domain-containing protein [Halegenticoccus tardaugens]
MGLFKRNTPDAYKVDEQLSESLREHVERENRPVLGIRPYRGEDGIERGERLLNSLHDVRRSGFLNRKNGSPPQTFELHYTDDSEILQFRFVPGDTETKRRLLRQLKTYYPDSDILEAAPTFMDIEPGMYVAGARLSLRDSDYFKPIKHFRIDPDHFAQDPYDSITSEMVGAPETPDADVLVQFVLRPAFSTEGREGKNWFAGIEQTVERMTKPQTTFDKGAILDEIGRAFTPGESEGKADFSKHMPATNGHKKAAAVVADQYGKKGYHLNIRILAVSEDADEAVSRVQETAGMYRKFYNSKYEQGFEPTFYSAKNLPGLFERAAAREWRDRGMVFATDTLAGVCHVPTDLNTQQADYSMTTAGKGVPPRTPRFDFDAVGLDRATSPRQDKQRALLSDTDPSAPVWYGFGTRNGVEAGVYPDALSVHQFIGGSTGMGKTTLLKNYFRQIMQRGHGGLFFDPKGDDADAVVSLVPKGREDDLIFLDIGADAEYEVGFNFLEVPLRDPDPDSQAFESAVESLADDLEALLAQSTGPDAAWGARMSGVTRNVVRGLAEWQVRTAEDVTLLDMYYALLDEDGRQQYADMLSDARIQWIEDYAQDVVADMSQDELEPLIRRLKEWVESGTTRSIVSHPKSTISIEDAVCDGKIIVVRNRSSSESAKRMIATALIRRIWVAIREQTYSDTEPDPPNFYAVIDEFDKIVSKESKIHNILREARAFGLSLTLAAQNLETGGDDTIGIPEGIRRAIHGNCKTFLTFDPGDPMDAKAIAPQHSTDITPEDIGELSKYRIYMRTYDENDEKTDSFKVQTLEPAVDVLDVRDEAETEALIHAAQKRYGRKRRSNEEIKRDLLLHGDGRVSTGTVLRSEAVQQAACKAVYDAALRTPGNDSRVPLVDCADAIRGAVDATLDGELPTSVDISTDEKLWRHVLQPIPDGMLAEEERDGALWLSVGDATVSSIHDVGDDESSGGALHALVLRDAYPALTDLGVDVEIAKQGDGSVSLPDGTIDPTPLLDLPADADAVDAAAALARFEDEHPLVAQLTGGREAVLEAEKSTGNTKQGQTVRNLAAAYRDGKRCLFMCREDVAPDVWQTLVSEPAFAHKNHSAPGETRFYNLRPLSINGERAYRTGAREDVWVRTEAGEYILRDGDGTEHARFPDAESIFTDASAYDVVASEAAAADDRELRTVKTPIIPEREFDGEVPTPGEDWIILVVPTVREDRDEDETLTAHDLSVFVDGVMVPLTSLGQHSDEEQEKQKERLQQTPAQRDSDDTSPSADRRRASGHLDW